MWTVDWPTDPLTLLAVSTLYEDFSWNFNFLRNESILVILCFSAFSPHTALFNDEDFVDELTDMVTLLNLSQHCTGPVSRREIIYQEDVSSVQLVFLFLMGTDKICGLWTDPLTLLCFTPHKEDKPPTGSLVLCRQKQSLLIGGLWHTDIGFVHSSKLGYHGVVFGICVFLRAGLICVWQR